MNVASPAIPGSTRILVLVGITANRRKRRAVHAQLGLLTGLPVVVPWLPYVLGLSVCAIWLRWRWRALIGTSESVHLLLYIGGAAIFSLAAPRLDLSRLCRVVIDRGPIQELVPVVMAARMPPLFRVLPGGRAIADLARLLPEMRTSRYGAGETGLIVERGISDLAHRLGLTTGSVPENAWSNENLATDSTDVLHIDLSHDEVYDDDRFLRPAARFLMTGAFAEPTLAPSAEEAGRYG